MSLNQEVETLKFPSPIVRDDQDPLRNCSISLNAEALPDIDTAVSNTRCSSVCSVDTETLTPNFELLDAGSIYSKRTQPCEQYTRPFDTGDWIYSVATEKGEQKCEVSQTYVPSIFTPTPNPSITFAENSSVENIEIDNRHTNSNRYFLKDTFPRNAKSQYSWPASRSFNFPRKPIKEKENMPIYNPDIDDVDDFSQATTLNNSQFNLLKLQESEPSTIIQINLITENDLQDNRTTEVVVEEAQQILIESQLKRKRKSNRRETLSTKDEDKANSPAVINFQQKKIRARILGVEICAKNLSPSRSTKKSGDTVSPDSTSPENKKRRLNFPAPLIFPNFDNSPAPFRQTERKKEIEILDLTLEDDMDIAEESAVVLKINPQENSAAKPAFQTNLSTIATHDEQDVETTVESSLDVVVVDRKQNTSQKLLAHDEKRFAIVDNDFDAQPTAELFPFVTNDARDGESTGESSLGVVVVDKKQNTSQKLLAHDGKRFATVDNDFDAEATVKLIPVVTNDGRKQTGRQKWMLQENQFSIVSNDSLVLEARKREKEIKIIDLTLKDDMDIAEESAVVLKINPQENSAEKPAFQTNLSTITTHDEQDVETTVESSLDVVVVDRKQNTSQKLLAHDEKRFAIVDNDFDAEPTAELFPFVTNDARDGESTGESSLGVVVVDKKQNTSQKLLAHDGKRFATVDNDFDAEATVKLIPVVTNDGRKQTGRQKSMLQENQFPIVSNDFLVLEARKREKEIKIIDLTLEDDMDIAEESAVACTINSQEEPAAKPAFQVKLSTIATNNARDVETSVESSLDVGVVDRKQTRSQKSMLQENRSSNVFNEVFVNEASPELCLDETSNDRKEYSLLKCMTEKNRSAIVINDAEGKTPAKSTVFSPTDGGKSSDASSTTYFTQSSLHSLRLLSDHCSEYDRCLQDENLPHSDFFENALGLSTQFSQVAFKQQCEEILTFLDADNAANS